MRRLLPVCLNVWFVAAVALAQQPSQPDQVIPHHQSSIPGPALSPDEAIAKMTLPPGFSVELVASEPDIVNPVAMTFDERGRVWITESLEYPRSEAGPGRDRVKILEDTDGDGRADKFTVFAQGLNIPSGIAVGGGGVWVANAPDILLLEDTDGDDRADRREVVVTGFGRSDTHELPNSLTWGPDGWLYGLNGVFNHSRVKYRGRDYQFTCALFRIHPQSRDFELFAEGTSNPWGVAWNNQGDAFISACVIDHLWHLTESGYYHRQGGPYPPFTWKLESIVQHKHQMAAYCGIHFFDSDAYPAAYREKLYMGNIHGNCINSDALRREGATYFATPEPDLLAANDVWFMPVVQKTGPDGCLYVLDWYDRYHCYQDARRDPQGIDRLKGRLYRIRYQHTPRAKGFDLARETDEQLIERLHSANVYFRDIAQRLLWQRNNPLTRPKLEALVLNGEAPPKARMHALWALIGSGPLDESFHGQLLAHADADYRAWAVRAAGNRRDVSASIRDRVVALAADPAPQVRLQVAIAAVKLKGVEPVGVLLDVLCHADRDKLIPNIVWQNLHPLLEDQPGRLLAQLRQRKLDEHPDLAALLPRAIDRLLAGDDTAAVTDLLTWLVESGASTTAVAPCLARLAERVQTREIGATQLQSIRGKLEPMLHAALLAGPDDSPLYLDAALLAASWGDPRGLAAARQLLVSSRQPDARRLEALQALVATRHEAVLDAVEGLLADLRQNSQALRRRALGALGGLEDDRVADVVLKHYSQMEPALQPQAIELLTSRSAWSRKLLAAIERKQLPATVLNVNQVRKLLASRDPALAEQVQATWGTVRTTRDPARQQVIANMRDLLRHTPGDPQAGRVVYDKVCGQCHKIYGEGQEVGPDITLNGRGSIEQLLSNVFDPSLVIGADYRARTVLTTDGRVLTGLPVEDNPQRVVLRVQGGKLETIPRDQVDEIEVSQLSMMPEGVETQFKPQELADLFAFLVLDRPPDDPKAKRIPDVAPGDSGR